ncbi:STAS domain-containing protein [Pseudokineococcus sp. 1T1Z-3]|uniref:STAS domain-containing protein n=1 Tax=Pseudokineococcus sp. 1T1Z-3 TaxID=3132745 RepID=UPI0030962D0A
MSGDGNTGAPPRSGVATAGDDTADAGSVHVIMGQEKTRIVLSGEIDALLSPDLVEAAADAEDARRPVEVDAQHVTFMDSTGVAFLARLASRSHTRLVLIRPPDVVKFLIEVTSINDLLDVVDDDPGVDDTVPQGDDDGPDQAA